MTHTHSTGRDITHCGHRIKYRCYTSDSTRLCVNLEVVFQTPSVTVIPLSTSSWCCHRPLVSFRPTFRGGNSVMPALLSPPHNQSWGTLRILFFPLTAASKGGNTLWTTNISDLESSENQLRVTLVCSVKAVSQWSTPAPPQTDTHSTVEQTREAEGSWIRLTDEDRGHV